MKNFKLNLFLALAILGLLGAGCSNEKNTAQATTGDVKKEATTTASETPVAPAVAAVPVAVAADLAPDAFADPSKLTATAPETFKAQFATTKGKFIVEVTRSLAPNGADRFYNLVRSGYFKDVAFFRVVPGFMSQFGIHGDPAVSAKWRDASIADDMVKGSNTRGTITFATAGPNTRTTQLFINFGDNSRLDASGFSPFGKVIEGLDVVDKLNGEYGDGAPYGRGPDQGRIQGEGNVFLKKDFPNLDYINSAIVVQ
jgi:peptidyl-prolyl cis-trans isomerase A (cyclophilin A)